MQIYLSYTNFLNALSALSFTAAWISR